MKILITHRSTALINVSGGFLNTGIGQIITSQKEYTDNGLTFHILTDTFLEDNIKRFSCYQKYIIC